MSWRCGFLCSSLRQADKDVLMKRKGCDSCGDLVCKRKTERSFVITDADCDVSLIVVATSREDAVNKVFDFVRSAIATGVYVKDVH